MAGASIKPHKDIEPYKVFFNWSKPVQEKGKSDKRALVAVSCDKENIPSEEGWARIGNIVANVRNNASQFPQQACLTIKQENKIQFSKGSFLYMDVGCWLDGQQTFGLVCGDDAFVCDYGSTRGELAGTGKPAEKTGKPLLDDFMRFLGISVLFREKIPEPHPMDTNRMYLILPDMHVPESPPKSQRPPKNDYWNNVRGGSWDVDPRAFDAVSKRDLFNSRDSINAMINFLRMVRNFPSAKQITLVQLGDMYELWAERQCYFLQTAKPEIKLRDVHLPAGLGEFNVANQIGEWIGRTHQLYPDLFQAFDQCESKSMPLFFLYGNHDNYLARQEVIDAARDYIKTQSQYVETRNSILTRSKERRCEPSVVYQRQPEFNQDNLLIEHGQRCDHYNRDGETEGHTNANKVSDPHGVLRVISWGVELKKLGPTFRTTFVIGAAARWCSDQRKFGLYVMGHTHVANLRRVEVYHRLETINYVVGPDGVDIEIKTETPLEGASQ